MKGNRNPYTKDERLPQYEVVELTHEHNPIQLRYNFTEVEMEDRLSWNYDYVEVPNLKVETLEKAGVPENVIKLIK
jgi:uncharacterized protein (DUF2249 family)